MRCTGQCLIGLMLFGAVNELSAAPGAARPNLLFIMTDDHAAHALSCYGSRINQTPNLDRLAKEGMLFRNSFVTNSICGPSRAVILTGKYSHLNGYRTNGRSFDGSQQTFPKLLQANGYETAIIGKWHLESDPTGFDHWQVLVGQGPYHNPPIKSAAGTRRQEGYTTDVLTDLALDFLETGRDKSKPFLLMWHHKAPHREWQAHPRHAKLFKDKPISEPETLFDDYSRRGTAAHATEMTVARHLTDLDLKLVPPKGLTEDQLAAWHAMYDESIARYRSNQPTGADRTRWNYQRYIQDYLRCVAAVDDSVGRMLAYLDRSGLAENTLVVYTSDQGFFLGDHGWYDKRFMYEESLRAPLLVRWPGVVAPGTESAAMALNLDFPETLLEAAGVAIPAEMQGASLVPILRGATPLEWRKSIYYRYYEYPVPHAVHQHLGVRDERYKLIFYPQLDEWELFDLQTDPRELNNIYASADQAATIQRLKAELERLREHYRDTDPLPTPLSPKQLSR